MQCAARSQELLYIKVLDVVVIVYCLLSAVHSHRSLRSKELRCVFAFALACFGSVLYLISEHDVAVNDVR